MPTEKYVVDERVNKALVNLVAESRDEFDELGALERQLRSTPSVISPLEASNIANTLALVARRLDALIHVTAQATPDPAPQTKAPNK